MSVKIFNGELLREARQMRKLTISDLANKTEISKQSLSLYENNDNKPSGENIFKLSQALSVPYDYFLQENGLDFTSTTTYFRSLASTTKKSRISANLKMKFIAKIYEALNEVIDFPKFSLSLNVPELIDNDEIENITNKIRSEWNLGNEPIENMQYLLESHGILVTSFNVDDTGIGAFSKKINLPNEEIYIVAINNNKPSGRINFDLAHELGHIILHPWTEDLESLSREEFQRVEREANKFAGAFLMPAEKFKRFSGGSSLLYYMSLREQWHVSIQAAIYRFQELGNININQYQYLMKKLSQRGWRKNEPGDIPSDLCKNVFESAIDLLKEDGFSSQNILTLFKKHNVFLYASDIEELLGLEKGTLTTDNEQDIKKVLQLKHFDNDR